MLSLTLLCLTDNTAIATQRQLKEIFGDMVEIKSICIKDLTPDSKISDMLVVVTSQTIKDLAMQYIEAGAKIIIADRVVNAEMASKLFEIPKGSSVLIVNQVYYSANQAINQLQGLGISHVQF